MKKSNRAEVSEHEDGVDMLSNLPDHVLQLILSGIQSTEEVIRTSILSRRWRYLWTSVPSIDIDYTRRLDPLKRRDCNKFKEFVDWVLLKKNSEIVYLDSFRLRCDKYYDMFTVGLWVDAVVMRKVKVIDLMFFPKEEPEEIEVPQCLETCGSLEVLKLCLLGCRLILPIWGGFQALRVLELKEVDLLGDNMIKYFPDSCPLLEDLSLIDCNVYFLVLSSPTLKNLRIDTRQLVSDEEIENNDDLDWRMCLKLEICCPKLEFLKLTGYVAMEFVLENLDSLKKAVIHPKNLDWRSFSKLEISQVESLSISLYCVKQCYYPSQLLEDPISLPNLKTLEITVDDDLDILIPFLKCFVDIESLHLIFVKDVYGLDKWNLEEPATISILTRHLKKVEFLDFDEEKEKLGVARALLEHGNELEEMVFSWGEKARFHERSMQVMNQVSEFHKPSSIVKLKAVLGPSQAKSTE